MSDKAKILFVDDEAEILAGLRASLRKLRKEWDMRFVESASVAWPDAVPGVDVVVSDLRMPGMNGATFLENIRREHPQTGRIVLSGHADETLTFQAATIAHAWLTKPALKDTVVETIRGLLATRERLRDPRVRGIVLGARSVPTFPRLYAEVRRLIKNERLSIAEIASTIEWDPGMVARVLQLANSSLFARSTQVNKLSDALCALGLDVFAQVVLTAETLELFKQEAGSDVDVEKLAIRARNMIHVMRELITDPEEAELGALIAALHDAGRLLLAKQGIEDEEGKLHAQVAAGLAASWGMHADIINALSCHHETGSALSCCGGEFAVYLRITEAIVERQDIDDFEGLVTPELWARVKAAVVNQQTRASA